MMKLGFSSLVCPGWDLETIVTQASAMGFAGVELHGLRGDLHLPRVAELADDANHVRQLLTENNVELVCLGTSAHLDSCSRSELARQKTTIAEFLELAAKLGCPYVRIAAGEVQGFDHRHIALSRIADALRSMVEVASRFNVTLLVENAGDFAGSHELWFLIDAVGDPVVRCCWNQFNAMTIGERVTSSIPRLASKIDLVHVCDARFNAQGALLDYTAPGEGDVGIARQIDLLKGILYDGYLMFEWPKAWVETLPAPEVVLPEVVRYLRERVDEKQPILSAYKGDKRPPRMASPKATLAPAES